MTVLLDARGREIAPAAMAPRGVAAPWQGETYPGELGTFSDWLNDYDLLRRRSNEAFKTSLHGKGLIRRLVTNIVHSGLRLKSTPNAQILGIPPSELEEWSDAIDARFAAWGDRPDLCDYAGQLTFDEQQETSLREELIQGDMLNVLHLDKRTGLPRRQLINADRVRTPFERMTDPKIRHGVEVDNRGRHLAYWVTDDDGRAVRIPAYGKTGRRMAWLSYPSELRHGDVRGEPLMGIILRSLKELDGYRGAAMRKAVISSMISLFIRRNQHGAGPNNLGDMGVVQQTVTTPDDRQLHVVDHIPGMVVDMLQPGEDIVGGTKDGVDINYPVFESAIVHAIAWANEVPPDILQLAFSKSYSASTAGNSEFNSYLAKKRKSRARQSNAPVYEAWVLAEATHGRIKYGEEIAEAVCDPEKYAEAGAWMGATWLAAAKAPADKLKEAKANEIAVKHGWKTHHQVAAENGSDWGANVRTLGRERATLAELPGGAIDLSPAEPSDDDDDSVEDKED